MRGVEKEFREILSKYGVNKCYVSPDYDFNPHSPYGTIRFPFKYEKSGVWDELYELLVADDVEDEDMCLMICPSKNENYNYSAKEGFIKL